MPRFLYIKWRVFTLVSVLGLVTVSSVSCDNDGDRVRELGQEVQALKQEVSYLRAIGKQENFSRIGEESSKASDLLKEKSQDATQDRVSGGSVERSTGQVEQGSFALGPSALDSSARARLAADDDARSGRADDISEKSAGDEAVVAMSYRINDTMSDDAFLGKRDADNLIMVFSNYQCRHCRDFYRTVLGPIEDTINGLKVNGLNVGGGERGDNKIGGKKGGDSQTGKGAVYYVVRDFSSINSPNSIPAAEFAHCAGEQGKYWEARRQFYLHPELVDVGNWPELSSKIKELNGKKMANCFDSHRYRKENIADENDGRMLGITGAPSIFVGKKTSEATYKGYVIRGAQPTAVIKHYIQQVTGLSFSLGD